MKPAVQQAIEEIRKSFVGHRIDAEADSDGGAFVKVHELDVGGVYQSNRSWIAFRITFQYPFADVYPHFCVPELKRKDGAGLGEGFSMGQWSPPSGSAAAMQISRRSNRWDSSTDTAAIKLHKVLTWLRSR